MPKTLIDSSIMQRHANVLVDKAGDKNLRFKQYADGWSNFVKTKKGSMSDSAALVNRPDFNELVKMGTSIIPNVMNRFTKEKDGAWHLLLNTLTGRKATGAAARRPDEYQRWAAWYSKGGDPTKLPT
jgi:hypothetical protein